MEEHGGNVPHGLGGERVPEAILEFVSAVAEKQQTPSFNKAFRPYQRSNSQPPLPFSVTLVTIDVTALYTSIPLSDPS